MQGWLRISKDVIKVKKTFVEKNLAGRLTNALGSSLDIDVQVELDGQLQPSRYPGRITASTVSRFNLTSVAELKKTYAGYWITGWRLLGEVLVMEVQTARRGGECSDGDAVQGDEVTVSQQKAVASGKRARQDEGAGPSSKRRAAGEAQAPDSSQGVEGQCGVPATGKRAWSTSQRVAHHCFSIPRPFQQAYLPELTLDKPRGIVKIQREVDGEVDPTVHYLNVVLYKTGQVAITNVSALKEGVQRTHRIVDWRWQADTSTVVVVMGKAKRHVFGDGMDSSNSANSDDENASSQAQGRAAHQAGNLPGGVASEGRAQVSNNW